MRFIHTSDWHLGRILDQFHLTEDQHHVLDQLLTLAGEAKADAFLISGDVYDRGVPPPQAVELLDEFVSRLALDLKIPLIIIAGNHDSRERLGFGAKVMTRGNLFLFGAAQRAVSYVDLPDAHGKVRFYALPYAEPADWRQTLEDESIKDHTLGFARYLGDVRASHPKNMRSVLLAHCFAAGGQESESERPLVIGGGGLVDAQLFDFFDYAALGHLHRPQRAGKAWYSGSLLKYSKSEADHNKSVCVVDMDPSGTCRVERVALSPKRELRVVEGLFQELEHGAVSEDYVHVVLKDQQPVLDVANRLRQRFPNLLGVERPNEEWSARRLESSTMAKMTEDELFKTFFEQMSGEKPNEGELRVFMDAAAEIQRAREESPQ